MGREGMDNEYENTVFTPRHALLREKFMYRKSYVHQILPEKEITRAQNNVLRFKLDFRVERVRLRIFTECICTRHLLPATQVKSI